MAFQLIPEQQTFEDKHSMAETRDWHSEDVKLRAAGFSIYARPGKGEALWSKGGSVYRQTEALVVLEARERLKGGL